MTNERSHAYVVELEAERDQLRLALQREQEISEGRAVMVNDLKLALQEAQNERDNMLIAWRESRSPEELRLKVKQLNAVLQESQQRVKELEHANNSWIYENEKWKEQRDWQQATIRELESYKAHHKTCLQLAEEVNRDITLERRANASLRSKVEQQQTIIQELAEALREIQNTTAETLTSDRAKAATEAAAPWPQKEEKPE